MTDIAAIEARHTPMRIAEDAPHEQTTICTRDEEIWPCDTVQTLARLHEVEAERDEARDALTITGAEAHEVLAESIAAHANAITPQQRAVLERVDYIRVVGLAEKRRSDEGQRDLWVAEMLTAASAAVDALTEAER